MKNVSHEIWRPIINYADYEISNFGRVKSYKIDGMQGKILSTKDKSGWYLSVGLTNENGIKSHRIHQLVANSFIGEIITINKIIEVDHIDGNKQNNHIDNLRYLDKKTHSKKTISDNPEMTRGIMHYNQVIRPNPVLQYDLQGNFIKEYKNSTIAADETGVCKRNILQVANKDYYNKKKKLFRKQAGGFIWKNKAI